MNEVFRVIDYKEPIGTKDDFRTSTYRGHRYVDGTARDLKLNVKYPEYKIYREDPDLIRSMVSDYKDNFVWKYGDPYAVRNPQVEKLNFVKPYVEKLNFYLETPLKPATSVTHKDFTAKCLEPQPQHEPVKMPYTVIKTPIVIDRIEHGYTKYLDPAATTSRLDYCNRSPQQILKGIAAHDNITFWNWNKHYKPSKRVFSGKDEQQCDYYPAKECVKRRNEYPSLVKAVPNSGMTTEVRQNYQEPYKKSHDYDDTEIRNRHTYLPILPFSDKTEYKFIGSGERVQKYV